MNSPWQVSLSLVEASTSRVAVCFYNRGWIPIAFYPLGEAIKLHHKASNLGMDIAVFPADLDPRNLDDQTPVLSERVCSSHLP